ncbi:MAG: UbiA family prenyltransferase [Angustibacter sp.]
MIQLAATGDRVRGLLLASHPGPTLGVTLLVALLATAAGVPIGRTVLLAAVVGVGQLSVGWGNDWVDATRDEAVGRIDKPITVGRVPRTWVRRAAIVAVVVTVPASATLGPRAAALHLLFVGSAWSYNLGVKATAWSWLPYAVSFGALPALVTATLPAPAWPAWWASGAGALLGIGAHLVNVLPDVDADLATGVRGLPHRLGHRAAGVLAPLAAWGSTALVVLGPPGSPGAAVGAGVAAPAVVAPGAVGSGAVGSGAVGSGTLAPLASATVVAALLVGATVAAVAGAVLAIRGNRRAPLWCTVGVAVANVALLAVAGSRIVS